MITFTNVTKMYGDNIGLENASVDIQTGDFVFLVGPSGAGKSTFIKVITGVHQPNSGKMLLNGKEVTFKSTEDSAKMGIAAIYQHVTAFPDLSVTENIFMGQEIKNKLGKQGR